MLQHFNISNEVVSVDVSRELGKLIEVQVGRMRKAYESTSTLPASELARLSDIVFMTGLRVEYRSIDGLTAAMLMPSFIGHQGTAWTAGKGKMLLVSKDGINAAAKIDLVKLQISGEILKDLPFTSYIGTSWFDATPGFTDAEITAVILHELGHGFNTIATLSDYIWLNYMLTDGIDVLLGNKRNVYKLEVLDQTWVEKNIAKEMREDFVNKRSPAQARRAIMATWKKAPRHYLFENNGASQKRDEQMADMFTTRLGYGRALAVALNRSDKYHGLVTDQRTTVAGGIGRVALAILGLPLILVWMLVVSGTSDMNLEGKYDNPRERNMKIRMDLINQLKSIKDRSLVSAIQQDIDTMDVLIKEYHNDTTLFDALYDFASPVGRKEKRLLVHEENLEHLFNNDLFVTANRYNS